MGSIKSEKFNILFRPRVTEKAAFAGSHGNCVVFQVHPKANKHEVRSAVESIFEVKVKHVRTANCRGKNKRLGLHVGRRNHWKKAYVYLAEGSSIDVIEAV